MSGLQASQSVWRRLQEAARELGRERAGVDVPLGMLPMGTANDQGRSFGIVAGVKALARYFVAPATDKPRALRALARGIAKRQRTSVHVYIGTRRDPFVPLTGLPALGAGRADAEPTEDERALADFFVGYALRTGTLIVYVPRAPDTGAPGGALDRFVASALGVQPARGLGVHAAYAVDAMLTHTGATPRAVLREPPSDLASGLGAARPLQAAVPGLAWLATPLPAPAPAG